MAEEHVSKEMDEVLDDLAREGVDLGTKDDEDGNPVKEAPESDKESEQQGDEDEAVDDSEDEEETDDESEDEESEDELEEESEEDEGSEFSDDDVELSKKKSVPIQKLNYWKEKAKKLAKDFKELKDTASRQEINDKLKEVAEKEGIPLDRMNVLIEAISSQVITPEMRKKIDAAAQYQEQVVQERHQEVSFSKDFNANVRSLILNDNPDITQGEFAKLYNSIKEAAFAPTKDNEFNPKLGRAPKSLVDIYLSVSKPTRRVTGERTHLRSRASVGGASLEDVKSPEDVWDMSDEDFENSFSKEKVGAPKMIGKKPINR